MKHEDWELEPGNPYSNPFNWVAVIHEGYGGKVRLDHGNLMYVETEGQILLEYVGPSGRDS